jgi:hypothetical protein
LGRNRTPARRPRIRAIAAGFLAGLAAVALAACGGGSSSDSNERAGNYPVAITQAEFPAKQHLGQTSLMRIGVRNTGKKTIPALTVSVTVRGKEGEASSLPFAVRDPQPGIAQPDRPVWVLAAHYPKRAGDPAAGGTETSSAKTFSFGPLKANESVVGIWKLSAVKAGDYKLLYGIDAGVGGTARAKTAAGKAPRGSFAVKILTAPPNTIVTDSGEVVEVPVEKKQPAR